MLEHDNMETKGLSPTPGKQSHTIIYNWHSAIKRVSFSWQAPNPDSFISRSQTDGFFTPENTSPLL